MRHSLGLMAIAILIFSTASNAEVTDNWKMECVGRYQVSLPGDIDVAVDKVTEQGDWIDNSYADGQTAVFSKLLYSGHLTVISPALQKDFVKLKQIILKQRDETKQELLGTHSPYSESDKRTANGYKPIRYNTPTMFGWDTTSSDPGIFYFRDNKIFSYSPNFVGGYDSATSQSENAENIKHYNTFLNDFRTRAIFEVPKQEGVCIPYGFIPDDGKQPHEIAVTMRLLDHPDIEVALRDSTNTGYTIRDGKSMYTYLDPKEAINDLFANSGITNASEKEEVNFPGYHSVEMNGQKGGAVFITITRKDGSKDYGYIAAVQGTADTPGLLLYVIRTASRAKGKPVSKDELKDMAEKIVASVKRHAIQ